MKLLDKSINNLSQRLDKLYPDTASSNSSTDGINHWKGRKIIPLDKWLKITKANTISRRENYNVKEGLQYFPDGYFGWMFPLGIQEEDLKEQANKWYSDYIELMEYRRNPRIGRTKCFRCLLSPSREESALFIGINKVIARAIEQEDNNISSSTIYPCPILNRFECPFDKKKNNNNNNKIKAEEKEESNLLDVDDLFSLSEIAFQVELAFGHAYSMSKSNETIYEADFEADKVKEIYANYRGDPYSFSTEYPLEEKFREVKRLSKVPIRNVQDVYKALTDRETLNKVLEQGLDDEEYQRHRDELVNLFMSMKDKVRIEDLMVYEPIFTLNIQKSKCFICQEFANIHCTNCSSNNNIWLCVDHWKQHKVDKHTLSI